VSAKDLYPFDDVGNGRDDGVCRVGREEEEEERGRMVILRMFSFITGKNVLLDLLC